VADYAEKYYILDENYQSDKKNRTAYHIKTGTITKAENTEAFPKLQFLGKRP
jgi:hypothetical protein